MKKKKDIKSFMREEDGKAIKKSLLIASLGLVLGFGTSVAGATNVHTSSTGENNHNSTHANHSNHSSY